MNLTNINMQKSVSMKRVANLKFMIQKAALESNSQSVLTASKQQNYHHNDINNKTKYPSQSTNSPLFNQLKAPKKKLNLIQSEKQNIVTSQNSQKLNFKNIDQNMIKSQTSQHLKKVNGQQIEFKKGKNEENVLSNSTSQLNIRNISIVSSFQINPKITSSSSTNILKSHQTKKQPTFRTLHKKIQWNINKFQLGKKIGKGRFGSVYIAQEKLTKLVLAIKIINKQQLKQSNMETQLISEIKLQMYSKHPNLLKMYGFFHDQTNIYLLIELAEDCLFHQINKNQGLPQKQAAYYVKQICQALKYMHSQSIIHRDIKPENILLINGVAKLADFGWSTYSPLYKRQTFCGTLDYVCPQIVEGSFYDEKSDIWSLGILMYELVAGNAPFQGSGQEETFNKIMNGCIDFPEHLGTQLKTLIKEVLVKNPKKRLSLKQINNSEWVKKYQKQGRYIGSEIWQFWNS